MIVQQICRFPDSPTRLWDLKNIQAICNHPDSRENRTMKLTTILIVLFSAAVLEAGGDAIIRLGLRNSAPLIKTLLFVAGGLVLFSYGWVVNTAPWNFGQLIGIYIVFFFVVAQILSWLVFAQP